MEDGMAVPSPLKNQPGYAEWRMEQDAALAAAKKAYEAELENEKRAQEVEERKRERLRQLERVKRIENGDQTNENGYDDASRAVERYRTERWREGPLNEVVREEYSSGPRVNQRERPVSGNEQYTQQTVYKPRSSEEEKRRRRKIQYQVFVHAR
jgi:hypothetical protein